MAKFVSVEVRPTCYVGSASIGTLAWDITEVKGVVPTHGGSAMLKSVTYLDLDDRLDASVILFFKKGTNSLGTLGSDPSITDAQIVQNGFLGAVNVPKPVDNASGDFYTQAYGQSIGNIDLVIDTADGSNSIYIAGLAAATRQYTAEGTVIRLGFEVN
jgi:hypothetical protein